MAVLLQMESIKKQLLVGGDFLGLLGGGSRVGNRRAFARKRREGQVTNRGGNRKRELRRLEFFRAFNFLNQRGFGGERNALFVERPAFSSQLDLYLVGTREVDANAGLSVLYVKA